MAQMAQAEISFTPAPFAADDAAKGAAVASASAMVNGTKVALAYHVIARSGDIKGTAGFGLLMAAGGTPIAGAISANADFTSPLPKNGKLYSVTQFEDAPGGAVRKRTVTSCRRHLGCYVIHAG